MKHNKEHIKEIFNTIWKKIINRNKNGNLQSHTQSEDPDIEPIANKQMRLAFNKKRPQNSDKKSKLSKPRQLTLPLRIPKSPTLKTYTNVDKFVKDNFNKNTYIGPDLSDFGFTMSHKPGFRLSPGTEVDEPFRDTMYIVPGPIMKWYNTAVKKKIKADKDSAQERMKSLTTQPNEPKLDDEEIAISEITSIIQEIVEEELSEINHTTDSAGGTIIAQGAPGSVIRFATENPDIIKQMRDWIKDCQWQDLPDEAAVDELSDEEVLRGIQNNYDGGIKDFLRGSNSQAQVPVGYKESLKENWSSGQQDDAPDGFSNDYQRAFAHSQATTPRENQTEKAKQLAKTGKFVVLVGHPVYCRTTDAVLGMSTTIEKVCNSREEAEKELEKFNTAEHSDDHVSIIGPDNLEPKQHKDTTGDDVPFQEGVGYVYDKDMKKDPKHIPGERWRVKYEEGFSKSELKGVIKELINEMWYGSKNDVEGDETHDEPVNEVIFDTISELEKFVKKLPRQEVDKITAISQEMGLGAMDSIIEYIRRIEKEKKSLPIKK